MEISEGPGLAGFRPSARTAVIAARCCAVVCAAASVVPAFAQEVRAGLKAGVPLTPYYRTGTNETPEIRTESTAATRRYTLGATAELRLGDHFGFELDALFRRTGYVLITATHREGVLTRYAIDTKGNSWDFPLLAKCRFRGVATPYLAAGGALRYLGPIRGRGEVAIDNGMATPIDTTDPPETRKRLYPGVVAACGLEIRVGRLRVLPEVRYTRWTANFSVAENRLGFQPNQMELLLGLVL